MSAENSRYRRGVAVGFGVSPEERQGNHVHIRGVQRASAEIGGFACHRCENGHMIKVFGELQYVPCISTIGVESPPIGMYGFMINSKPHLVSRSVNSTVTRIYLP